MMSELELKNILVNLEQLVRYYGSMTNWIHLEPIQDRMLEELEYISYSPEAAEPKVPTQKEKKKFQDKIFKSNEIKDRYIDSESMIDQPKPSNVNVRELDPMEATNLDSLKLRIRDCQKCQLCEGRSTVVFGQGNQSADIIFIGEGPGADEDRKGLAFVGKAGKLLTQMIHSIGLNRESVYICNIVKCRPPGNRNPSVEEITACMPFLLKQIEFIKPKVIVSLGNVATKSLIPDAKGIMKMRGNLVEFNGIPLLPTFHPSYLLRNTNALTNVWNDMRKLRQLIHKFSVNDPEENHPQE